MKFSKDYVMFCHITTAIPGEKHGELLQEKGGQGWPYFAFMDAEGNVIARHDDEPAGPAFAKTGEKAKAFLSLKAKAETGDKPAQVDFLLAQLELGLINPADAEQKFKEATPSKEQEAKYAGLLMNVTVMKDVDALENNDQEKALGKKYYDHFKAGKPAPTNDQAMQWYYVSVLEHSEEKKDLPNIEAVLKILTEKVGKTESTKDFFERWEKKLAGLLMDDTVMKDVDALEGKDRGTTLGKKYYDHFKAGKPGPTSEQAMQPYYVIVLNHSEEQKDPQAIEAVLVILRDKFGKNEFIKDFFEKWEKKLAELKK